VVVLHGAGVALSEVVPPVVEDGEALVEASGEALGEVNISFLSLKSEDLLSSQVIVVAVVEEVEAALVEAQEGHEEVLVNLEEAAEVVLEEVKGLSL
jgi:hypothetical protein